MLWMLGLSAGAGVAAVLPGSVTLPGFATLAGTSVRMRTSRSVAVKASFSLSASSSTLPRMGTVNSGTAREEVRNFTCPCSGPEEKGGLAATVR